MLLLQRCRVGVCTRLRLLLFRRELLINTANAAEQQRLCLVLLGVLRLALVSEVHASLPATPPN